MADNPQNPGSSGNSDPQTGAQNGAPLESLLDSLLQHLPEQLRGMRDELQKNFRPVLQNRLSDLDLVTRDEFDAQSRMLARSRARLNSLQADLERLEEQLSAKPD